MRSDVEYVPEHFARGIGPIYSRYKRLATEVLLLTKPTAAA